MSLLPFQFMVYSQLQKTVLITVVIMCYNSKFRLLTWSVNFIRLLLQSVTTEGPFFRAAQQEFNFSALGHLLFWELSSFHQLCGKPGGTSQLSWWSYQWHPVSRVVKWDVFRVNNEGIGMKYWLSSLPSAKNLLQREEKKKKGPRRNVYILKQYILLYFFCKCNMPLWIDQNTRSAPKSTRC